MQLGLFGFGEPDGDGSGFALLAAGVRSGFRMHRRGGSGWLCDVRGHGSADAAMCAKGLLVTDGGDIVEESAVIPCVVSLFSTGEIGEQRGEGSRTVWLWRWGRFGHGDSIGAGRRYIRLFR